MVSQETTDEIFRKLQQDQYNRFCADCDSDEIAFASISHGSLICAYCAEEHRGLGLNVSFVKSLNDPWTIKQLKLMTVGGNISVKSYLESYGIPFNASIEYKYTTVCAKYYREMLKVIADGNAITEKAPSKDEGFNLITNPKEYGQFDLEEEDKKLFGITNLLGNAFNTTLGVGKGIFGKVKDIEAYKKIEDTASTAVNKVGKGIRWGAQKGKEHLEKGVVIGKEGFEWGKQKSLDTINKGVELGKESIEWTKQRGLDHIEKGANKGVKLIKSGVTEAYGHVSLSANNTYGKLQSEAKAQVKNIKDETMNFLSSLEKNTIGKLGEKVKRNDDIYVESDEDRPASPPF